jgi:hypothetical protein
MIRRYLWQFLGSLLALGAIFSTYDVFTRSRSVKELQVILNTPIPYGRPVAQTPGNVQSSPGIQLSYNNTLIQNAVIFQATVKNSGNQPIVESDYSKPLSFFFEPQDQLLDAAVSTSDPPNIGMVLKKTSSYQAVADPVLLNPGDMVSINFTVLLPDDPALSDHFHVDGRIVGVSSIKLVTAASRPRAKLDLGNISIFSVLGVLAGILSSWAYERLQGAVRKPVRVKKGDGVQPPNEFSV